MHLAWESAGATVEYVFLNPGEYIENICDGSEMNGNSGSVACEHNGR